ncbi:MAG: hypothetical protein ACR2PT_21590 [Endozoicomonas sp.]
MREEVLIDVENLRFHLAVCAGLKIPGCMMLMKDDLSRSFWKSLVNMLDWSETVHPLFYSADQMPAGTDITFPRLFLKGGRWHFELSSQASSRSGDGIETETIFLKQTCECVYQDIKEKTPIFHRKRALLSSGQPRQYAGLQRVQTNTVYLGFASGVGGQVDLQ